MIEALQDARAVLACATSQSARMLLAKIDNALEGADGVVRDWWRPDPEDPFWMLEVRQGLDGAGSWLKNEETYLTTRDPTKALRFPSRFAADCAARRLPSAESLRFEPTDHQWMTAAPNNDLPTGNDGAQL